LDGTFSLAASQANVGDKPRRYEKMVGQELRNKEWVDGKEP